MKSEHYTFCSFASDDGWLGALLLSGLRTPTEAVAAAYQLGVHPGGEVLVLHSPEGLPEHFHEWHRANLNRLLTREEMEASPIGAVTIKAGECIPTMAGVIHE